MCIENATILTNRSGLRENSGVVETVRRLAPPSLSEPTGMVSIRFVFSCYKETMFYLCSLASAIIVSLFEQQQLRNEWRYLRSVN